MGSCTVLWLNLPLQKSLLSIYCEIFTFSSLCHLFSIFSEDPTPCSGIKCPFHGTCRLKEDGTPYCACLVSCPENYRPVCGSDVKSYLNECFLRIQSCLLQKQITVKYSDHCSKFVLFLSFSLPIIIFFNRHNLHRHNRKYFQGLDGPEKKISP